MWAIWHARNKFMHENVLMCPQSVLEMGMRLLNNFQRVTAQQSSSGFDYVLCDLFMIFVSGLFVPFIGINAMLAIEVWTL